MSRPPRVLVLGWSSVVHGEATAGDVLSMRAVEGALAAAGIAVDVAWSPVMATAPGAGGVLLQDADPAAYTAVVWACGPLHGAPVREVLDRFAGCRRLAVGVSVVDPDDPAVTGWDAVWARDAPGTAPVRDLAAGPAAAWGSGAPSSTGAHLPWPRPELGHGHAHDHAHGHAHDHAHGHDHGHGQRPVPGAVPVVGVYVAPGQAEYGVRRRHDAVLAALGEWGPASGAARVALDTRLDPRGWRDPDAPGQVLALAERCDAVVSMRLHGMVLALARGVPVVALDPVAGGGKVAAQAAAWGWPAVLTADAVTPAAVQAQLAWCLAAEGRAAAARARAEAPAAGAADLAAVVAAVQDRLPVVARTTGTH